MSETKGNTHFDKGARVINAVIAEVDLPDELKSTAQRVVNMIVTEILPGLWLDPPSPQTAEPATRAKPEMHVARDATGKSEEERAALALFRRALGDLIEDDVCEVPTSRSSPPPSLDAPDVKLMWSALDMLRRVHTSQLDQLSGALMVALQKGADPLDVFDVLMYANEYRAKDLTLPRLLALTHRSAEVD